MLLHDHVDRWAAQRPHGEFAVQGVFTIGAPVEATLPRDVLSVAVRHTDDPVAGLAGGGSPYGTGSPDSLVITRTR